MIGVYIHVPFCLRKCLYCDFPSQAGQDGFFEAYKNAVIYEIDHSKELSVSKIDSVFFGGGTPTALPARYLSEILGHILRYAVMPDAEVTVEANPGSVDFESLHILHDAGFNRLSLGVQTWQDHLLKRIGRIHTGEDITSAYEAAVNAGFNNINLDLMFSLPDQSMDDWTETLQKSVCLKPVHISAYSLILEEGTEMYRLYEQGALNLPDEDEDRRMYYVTADILGSFGYRQYEISNYALEDCECRHNIKYWTRQPYLGFGTDSHSFFDNTRWRNTHCLDKYLRVADMPEIIDLREEINRISSREAMEEAMFLGLRLNEGVDANGFYNAFGVNLHEVYGDVIRNMNALGLLDQSDNRIFLTAKGRDVSNYVFTNFMF